MITTIIVSVLAFLVVSVSITAYIIIGTIKQQFLLQTGESSVTIKQLSLFLKVMGGDTDGMDESDIAWGKSMIEKIKKYEESN